MTFQFLGLFLIAILVAVTVLLIVRRTISFRIGLLWMMLWIAGGAALVNPELTVVVAQALGIRRGADLLLYCSVLAMPGGFLLVYLRFRRVDEEMTKLVRELAILRAESEPEQKGPRSTRS